VLPAFALGGAATLWLPNSRFVGTAAASLPPTLGVDAGIAAGALSIANFGSNFATNL